MQFFIFALEPLYLGSLAKVLLVAQLDQSFLLELADAFETLYLIS
jgi:hypothetical protein